MEKKEITDIEAIEMSKVSKATFYRLVKELDRLKRNYKKTNTNK